MKFSGACGMIFFIMASASPVAAQGSLSFFAGAWNFKVWFGDSAGPPDLTAEWRVRSGLDSADVLTGQVVLNETYLRRRSWASIPAKNNIPVRS